MVGAFVSDLNGPSRPMTRLNRIQPVKTQIHPASPLGRRTKPPIDSCGSTTTSANQIQSLQRSCLFRCNPPRTSTARAILQAGLTGRGGSTRHPTVLSCQTSEDPCTLLNPRQLIRSGVTAPPHVDRRGPLSHTAPSSGFRGALQGQDDDRLQGQQREGATERRDCLAHPESGEPGGGKTDAAD